MSNIDFLKVVSRRDNLIKYPYPIQTKLGKGVVNNQIVENSCKKLSLVIKDKEVASELYILDKEKKSLFGLEIKTIQEYRNKGFRFGEILRLFSIVELIQNGLNSINIVSRPNAMIFHKKYKFIPDLVSKNFADPVLRKITLDNSDKELESVNKNAGECINNKEFDIQKANKILDEYLSVIIEKNLNPMAHILSCAGIPMVLTQDRIKKNSVFFNELFMEHNIDFEI